MEVTFTPVGVVRSPRAEATDYDWAGVFSTVTLDAARFGGDAVAGLEQSTHVEVVYLFDRVDPVQVRTSRRHPRGNRDWPAVGIFAQRARARPNRIGVYVCRLLGVDGLVVTVEGLDAIDATPVLDIKPYLTELALRGRCASRSGRTS